ncbi:MAG: secretion system protein [Clostridiales bacterium]|nr:MAG: secretion system protein [Clostridiales bacterium]
MKYIIIIFTILTFFCVFTAFIYLIKKKSISEKRRIEKLFSSSQKSLKNSRSRTNEVTNHKSSRHYLDKLSDELYVANIFLRPEEFIIIWLVSSIVIPVVLLFLGANAIMCLGVAIIGAVLPITYVKLKRRKRLAQFDKQLLDSLSIICNSLRAGLSFQTAMHCISQEMEEPISKEFGRVYRECQMGMSLELSFQRLVERTENKDLELMCSAVLIQKQIGGNLATVLDNIVGTIEERVKMKREIKTLTSAGMMSGYIIGALPLFMLVIMMVLNPTYVEVLFTTQMGNIMLIAAVVLEAIGFSIVKKIVSIKM